ncbi:MAG: hypothetical protein SAQ54_25405, partial [Oscillatoria sp. PMC 1050.18]|nr:hypothetical protein [Oscillatoria sp. PMC 1050.18]
MRPQAEPRDEGRGLFFVPWLRRGMPPGGSASIQAEPVNGRLHEPGSPFAGYFSLFPGSVSNQGRALRMRPQA